MVLKIVVFCPTHFVSGPKQFDKECRYDVSGVRDSHGSVQSPAVMENSWGPGQERELSHPGKIPPSSRQQEHTHIVSDDSIES